MRRRMKRPSLVLTLILIVPLLSGCWNRNELNELAVVIAMGIDSLDSGDYEVTVQIVDPAQMSRNKVAERAPTLTVSEHASTIFEAIRKMTTKASRKMYFSHMTMIIFDEKTARQGISKPLDFLLRDHEVRPDFYLAVSKNTSAKYMMGYVSPIEVLPGMDMYKSLTVSQQSWAPTSAVHIADFIRKLVKVGSDPVLTGIIITGDKSIGNTQANVKQPTTRAEYKYTGLGVLREDTLIGWLSESESKAYSYITNSVHSTVGKAKCPGSEDGDQTFSLEVKHSSSKIVPKIRDGKPVAAIEVLIESNIGELQCTDSDLSKESELLKFQTIAEKDTQKMIQSGIDKIQKDYGTDVLGIGEKFHRKYPAQWKKWKEDWNRVFKDELVIELTVDYKIRQLGSIVSPISESIGKGE